MTFTWPDLHLRVSEIVHSLAIVVVHFFESHVTKISQNMFITILYYFQLVGMKVKTYEKVITLKTKNVPGKCMSHSPVTTFELV